MKKNYTDDYINNNNNNNNNKNNYNITAKEIIVII
jgi:hypothetical protein